MPTDDALAALARLRRTQLSEGDRGIKLREFAAARRKDQPLEGLDAADRVALDQEFDQALLVEVQAADLVAASELIPEPDATAKALRLGGTNAQGKLFVRWSDLRHFLSQTPKVTKAEPAAAAEAEPAAPPEPRGKRHG